MTHQPTNNYEALVLALRLAIEALAWETPDEAKAAHCVEMAAGFASNLSESEVERAKKEWVVTYLSFSEG